MRHVVLPNVKYSFYAGTLDYTSVEKMQELYKETKNLLKTNGHGWAEPVCDSCEHLNLPVLLGFLVTFLVYLLEPHVLSLIRSSIFQVASANPTVSA